MKPSVSHLRRGQRRSELRQRGLVRRVLVAAAKASGIWQLLGYKDADGNQEPFDAVEVFSGVGFASRPKDGNKVEAIVVHVGADDAHPVVVATRDKSTMVQLDEDETAVFNSTGAVVRLLKSGDVVVTCAPGKNIYATDGDVSLARELATKADIDALKGWAATHIHGGGTILGQTATPVAVPPSATGTTVLKGR